MNGHRTVLTVALALSFFLLLAPSPAAGDVHAVVARVNGTEIRANLVSVPLKNVQDMFAKHMGRSPGQEDSRTLTELQVLCEHWLLCAMVRKAVLRDARLQVSTGGTPDAEKARAESGLLRVYHCGPFDRPRGRGGWRGWGRQRGGGTAGAAGPGGRFADQSASA